MKKWNRSAKAALALAASAGLVFGAMSPASAATRSTVVVVESNSMTSLNPNTSAQNLVINTDIAYMTSMGFYYNDNQPAIIPNTAFGTYKVISQKPFKIQYKVNKGLVWSDGTPIDGVDLLLSHITGSSDYSIAAGLGDPADTKAPPGFDSLGYAGTYDTNISGDPVLTSDRMGVIITYKNQIPDWVYSSPSPFPVHTLMELTAGEKKLGSVPHNLAAKNKFLTAFKTKDTKTLKAMGKIWNNAYNIDTVDAKTNPLLLVNNGAYLVTSAVKAQRVTLTANPKYSSGPKLHGIDKIILNTISDGTAAVQALANHEVDVYAGQATADGLAALNKVSGIQVINALSASWEGVYLRSGDGPGETDHYTGPFANGTTTASKAQALDMRRAFLMAFPRDEIVDKVWKPLSSKSGPMDSINYFSSFPNYKKMVAANGSSRYTAGTQATRTADALKLVQKYYPTTSASSPNVKIKILWGTPSNARRISEAAIIKAGLAKAGFDADLTPEVKWVPLLTSNKYDAYFCGNGLSGVFQAGLTGGWKSGNTQDSGYANAAVDTAVDKLNATVLTDDQIFAQYLIVEKAVYDEAMSVNITQWPAVTAVSQDLKGVDPSPILPETVWNFWDWHF
jgi:peptide/nickel transport system substrate-binding protein